MEDKLTDKEKEDLILTNNRWLCDISDCPECEEVLRICQENADQKE